MSEPMSTPMSTPYDTIASLPFNHGSFYRMKGALLAVLKLLSETDAPIGNITAEEKEELLDLIDEITED